MNGRRIILLLIAAIAAIGIALLVRSLIGGHPQPQQPVPVAKAPVTVQILVALRDIAVGETLDETKVTWQAMSPQTLDITAIRNDAKTPISALVGGSVARTAIAKGEPITGSKIIKNGSFGVMAASLHPGMRAVSIPVSTVSVASGFIVPGNHADVVLTTNLGGRAEATIILSDIRILAVDQVYELSVTKIVGDVRMVTLELTPEQVKTLSAKQTMGQLSLALRPLSDAAGTGSDTIAIVKGQIGPEADGR